MDTDTVIIDTNVFVSALKSKKGQSYKVLQKLLNNEFQIALSVPLVLEYEKVLKKEINHKIISEKDINDFVNYLCQIGKPAKIYYLWRPFLKDPYDDHILEVALAANCKYIITFNVKDFKNTKDFGIEAINPYEFLKRLGGNI
jgi:putative PIN family toxin of toxin-antitoxin system